VTVTTADLPIDWRSILRTCAQVGIAPQQAWDLSVTEWRALVGVTEATSALPRDSLNALLARFPDHSA
jgi:Phage tail assembly chaperone protein, TAC